MEGKDASLCCKRGVVKGGADACRSAPPSDVVEIWECEGWKTISEEDYLDDVHGGIGQGCFGGWRRVFIQRHRV